MSDNRERLQSGIIDGLAGSHHSRPASHPTADATEHQGAPLPDPTSERKLRLLVVTQYFWPENFRINDLVSALKARGHDITVLTGLPNYPDGRIFEDYRRNPEAFTSFDGIPVIRVPMLPRGNGGVRLMANYASFMLSGLTIGAWKLRGRKFDAIFVFMISPITAVLPAILQRRLKRAPLFVWILDLWPETLAAVGAVRSPRLLAAVGRLVRFIYARTDRILVQSRSFFDNVRKYAGSEERLRYFPGWAEPIFEGGLDDVEPAPELAPFRDTFNILFAGNIGEAQDFPAVLKAAELLRDDARIRWLIIGDGRQGNWVREEIARRRLGERVFMLGRFPIERMPSFFKGADALLVSLKRDPIFAMTIPGKVQSYLAAGRPLLAMLDGEGARVIEDTGAGMVCPAGDSEALAARARELADLNPGARAEMATNARDYCSREFARETLVSSLEQWMYELHGRPIGEHDLTRA